MTSPLLPALTLGMVLFLLCGGLRPARASGPATAPSAELTEQQKIVHVLNRLGFGPRPGDVERVEKIGLPAYVRQQLQPETIDDLAAEKAIEPLDTLKMDSAHLTQDYWLGVRQFIEKQKDAGNSEDMKLRYGIDPSQMKSEKPASPKEPSKEPSKEEKPKAPEAAATDSLRCVGELQSAKLVRAVLSERQLDEVLVDFWGNHFNIDVKKGLCRPLKVADDRDVIRPHVLGKFRDLLGASAKSPAMIHYLDNQENSVVRERSEIEKKMIEWYVGQKMGMSVKGMLADKEGPNENYGREILELHTLGVEGGYTQKDVQEVARCFSGWTLDATNGRFKFTPNRHDNGAKTVLGHDIPAGGGIKDGEQVLDILAAHPSTARFISRELCQRFVSDDPPAELVDRTAKVFLDTQGDLRKVVESIVTSPEFFSPAAYRSKIKSPFEFAASAVRASGGQFNTPGPFWLKVRGIQEGAGTIGYGGEKLSAAKRKSLNWHVYDMGQPLFAFAAPTGYPEISTKWVSPGALIERLNFALALTGQNVTDVHLKSEDLVKGVDADQPTAVLDRLSEQLLHGEMTAATRRTLEAKAVPEEGEGKTVNVAKLTALILGSPEFQRR